MGIKVRIWEKYGKIIKGESTEIEEDHFWAPCLCNGCSFLTWILSGTLPPSWILWLCRPYSHLPDAHHCGLFSSTGKRQMEESEDRWSILSLYGNVLACQPIGHHWGGCAYEISPILMASESWLEGQGSRIHFPNPMIICVIQCLFLLKMNM